MRTPRDENWITVPGLFSIQSSLQKKNGPASVYVIGMVEQAEFVKVGIAANVSYRLVELQTASPFTLKILASKRFNSKTEARRTERDLHKQFSDVRMSGEWFRLDASALNVLLESL